jgi:hypothetical protein
LDIQELETVGLRDNYGTSNPLIGVDRMAFQWIQRRVYMLPALENLTLVFLEMMMKLIVNFLAADIIKLGSQGF